MKPAIRQDIQGLRAVAVLLVILSHLPDRFRFAGGFIGVDFFFVISGFVITRILVRRNAGVGAGRFFADFMSRRIVRLVPALSVVLIATIALSVLFAPTTELRQISIAGVTAEAFVSNFYYLVHFDSYWNPAVLRSPFLHTWSLGIEFQTYLVLPLLFVGFIGATDEDRVFRRTLAAVLALAAASFAAFSYLLLIQKAPIRGLDPKGLAFYSPVTRFWEFALGIVPALLASRERWREQRSRRVVTLLAWVFIAGGIAYSGFAKMLNVGVAATCLGVTLLLAQGERAGETRHSFLEWPLLVWLGDRSYSIYLWHWPLLVLPIWVLPGNVPAVFCSVLVTLLLSAVSYRFIEQKFRHRREETGRPILVTTLFVVAGSAATLALAFSISGAAWYSSTRPIASVAIRFPPAAVSSSEVMNAISGCTSSAREMHCKNFPDAPGEVVVIGDSLGYRALPAVNLAARQRGLNASMLWDGGCSIELNSCPKFVYDYLGRTHVVALIVATNYDRAADRMNGTEIAAGALRQCPPNTRTVDCPVHLANIKKYRIDAKAGLAQLETYSSNILVALPFPQQAKLVPQCLSLPLFNRWLSPAYDGEGCGKTSLQWQRDRQGLYPSAIREVSAGDPKVTVWDPTDYLCDGTWCPAVINDGEKIMDDGIHWTWPASRYLSPAFNTYLDARSLD